ncbi:Ribonuclease H domain [Canna indica]|uniref:Ribonuclease H domain n=1 Tax=Canna indica TaxID=4628 RepID=A0AAQ3JXN9_9LILI|nr:Ribonuclease H domain [Canna indica]
MLEQEYGLQFKYRQEWHKGKWLKENKGAGTAACSEIKKIGLNSLFCNVTADIYWSSKNPEASKLNKGIKTDPRLNEKDFYINCDAAWKPGNVNAGIGFCITDKNGNMIYEESSNAKADSPMATEMISIWKGILKSKELGLNKVKILSDCLPVVNILNKKGCTAIGPMLLSPNNQVRGDPI